MDREACETCEGLGHTPTGPEGIETCSACGGSGELACLVCGNTGFDFDYRGNALRMQFKGPVMSILDRILFALACFGAFLALFFVVIASGFFFLCAIGVFTSLEPAESAPCHAPQ